MRQILFFTNIICFIVGYIGYGQYKSYYPKPNEEIEHWLAGTSSLLIMILCGSMTVVMGVVVAAEYFMGYR